MFPEEALHCVEWAKDLFGTFFCLNPQNFNKLKNTPLDEIGFNNLTERQGIKKAVKIAEQIPADFDGCIGKARSKFQKLYHDDILQLIHVYPLDKMIGKPGEERPFWSLPKRPPKEQFFDKTNSVHKNFVAAYACPTAQMYGIKNPYDAPRGEEAKADMAEKASQVKVKAFAPDEAKARAIQSQVDKDVKEQKVDEDDIDAPEPVPEEQSPELTMIDTTLKKKVSLSPAALED